MNQDQKLGKWGQWKGRAKQAWGYLRNDEFKKAEGSVERLCGAIQEMIGDSRAATERKLGKCDRDSKKQGS